MAEATIICCDCSEYMRNADFYPSRFDSQSDAVRLISRGKRHRNHENTVGVIAMRPNSKADVLINCTEDMESVVSSLSRMRIGDNANTADGEINILMALQTARLALKHRKNKQHNQRIILFIGSPISGPQNRNETSFIKAGQRLKKNNVSVDVIHFGETEANANVLKRFIGAVNANNNCNLITVESGKSLSDAIADHNNEAVTRAQINGGFGFDDDDLQMAIRQSLVEERERQETKEQTSVDDHADRSEELRIEEEDEELLIALQLSMEDQNKNEDDQK